MADTTRENIGDWLRDAHAMEEQAEKLFSGQAERLKDYPGLSAKLNTEVNYIKEHQSLLSSRIDQLGTSTSIIKDAAGKVVASAQNFSGILVSDEPVKGILALHTFTQMAIGSYKILVAASEAVGDLDTKRICQTILEHTENRARWIDSELDSVTRSFLTEKAA